MRRRESNRTLAPFLAFLTPIQAFGSFWAVIALCASAHAQIGPMEVANRYDLADEVHVEEAGRTVRTYLDRVDVYLADGKWSEAVDSIRQVMEDSGGKLLAVSPNRYVTTRTLCHLKLVDFPPEALGLYRDLADPIAG